MPPKSLTIVSSNYLSLLVSASLPSNVEVEEGRKQTKNVTALGFESGVGVPYFLALHFLEPIPTGKKRLTMSGVVDGVIGSQIRTKSEVIRAIGTFKPPQVNKKGQVCLSRRGQKSRGCGYSYLEAETDEQGNEVRAQMLRSIPLLDQAAPEAVRQWKYGPAIIDGKPTGIIFMVTESFQLKS